MLKSNRSSLYMGLSAHPLGILDRLLALPQSQFLNSRMVSHHGIYFKNFLIYFWLCWVFVAARRLSLIVVSGGYSLVGGAHGSHCGRFSCGSQALRRPGLVVAAHGLSRPAACGIFPGQGSNLHLLHCKAESLLLSHQGSPQFTIAK